VALRPVVPSPPGKERRAFFIEAGMGGLCLHSKI
jgi:hypothetical protein